MTTKQTFDWLRHIEKAILDLDAIPLLGHAPQFDEVFFKEKLREFLNIPDLEIEPGVFNWHTQETLLETLGEDWARVDIAVLPLQGHCSLLMGKKDLNSLVSWTIEHKKGTSAPINEEFSEGLFRFLVMESLHAMQMTDLFKNFILRIVGESQTSHSRVFVMDLKLKAYQEKIFCRLVIPELFRKQWLLHFSKNSLSHIPKVGKSVEVLCSLEVARLALNHSEWKKIKVGDFLPLRGANVDPDSNSGSLYLSLGQKPLFRVRIKNNGLKILEKPIYEEETQPMDEDHDDLLSEIDELEKKQTLDPIPEDLEGDDSQTSREEFSEESDGDEKRITAKSESSTLEKIEMIPLNVVVELTRFKMTCEKLIHLKPGNLIEIDSSLDKPVSLVVNGKKIATGELVRVGDSLGVQIIEVG